MLFAVSAPFLRAQSGTPGPTAVVEGKVHDAQGHPVVAALISLEAMDPRQALVTTTDGQGQFRFGAVPVGSYTARAKLQGYGEAKEGPFLLRERETKSISFELASVQEKQAEKDPSKSLAFSDQPAFTVAGVTDTTALGGHGSGPIVRNSNALSKETASLAREAAGQPAGSARDLSHTGPAEEAAIRAKLAEKDNADLHAQLAEIEESEGHPLEAVKEYQRAAEMQPSEPHLFAWGAELLLHHAPEPAIEVFSKGHRLYPQSTRMLLGLGAAYYAERSKEQAEQTVLDASDLNPADPTPYLFLGRLQAFEKIEPVGWTDRMKRFVALHPQSAMAHYLYAVALMKQSEHPDHLDVAEGELETAIELDPRLGDAYLQLGILRTDRDDFSGAVSALQKAIESTPLPEEAHYRLAQVYRRMGNTEKANQEIAQFKQISEQKDEQAERERHEIPQFVYTLR
jgi:tetratricopeptide (TPR) repeat protein